MLNSDFNRRAGEVFGERVAELLNQGNPFVGRIMDDNSQLVNCRELFLLGEKGAYNEICKCIEKKYLTHIYAAKFLNHLQNRNPIPYDTYKYGKLPQ